MPDTVFYAWQSDLPSNVNRSFIRSCIDLALEELNDSGTVFESLRADQDTQGVAGDVAIANTIFAKIAACKVFICDITTITPAGAARPTPNPNVLIEYGHASVSPGSAFVVTIFNEAFGNWRSDRPFDMRHRRQPVLYNLPANHSPEQRNAARRRLAATLVDIIRAILANAPSTAPTPEITDFSTCRSAYWETNFNGVTPGRSIGFWIGLRPITPLTGASDLWRTPDILERRMSFNFHKGNASIPFSSIDAPLPRVASNVSPIHRGAKRRWNYRYNVDASGRDIGLDALSTTVLEDGQITISVRTKNLFPEPHLRREWIMAECANALHILRSLRSHTGNTALQYFLVVELRYDDQSSHEPEGRPVQTGQWRLCLLGDETGRVGTIVNSAPKTYGPLPITSDQSFGDALLTLYKQIVTSVERIPEDDISFPL